MSVIITGGSFVNPEKLVAKLVEAFKGWTEQDINDDYWREQFTTPKWKYQYEEVTRRKNPAALIKEADSPRDIYDYGDLYESGVKSYNFSSTNDVASADWKWDAKNSTGNYYAYYVHEGYGTNATPRKWTEELYVPAEFDASDLKRKLLARIKTAMGTK